MSEKNVATIPATADRALTAVIKKNPTEIEAEERRKREFPAGSGRNGSLCL